MSSSRHDNGQRASVMFPDSHNFQIHGGTFNNVRGDQNIYNISNSGPKNEVEKLLDQLNPRYTMVNPLRCLKGTREGILLEIRRWTYNFDEPNILWLHGYPGVGKSTIVATVAKELNEASRPTLIFAFNAKDGTTFSMLCRFMAFELASRYPVCRATILRKLKDGKIYLGNTTALEIFEHLVGQPLQQLASSLPNNSRSNLPVFIIDALDEFGSSDSSRSADREELCTCIAAWSKFPSLFKLIVTSRSQDDIRELFLSSHRGDTLWNIRPRIPHRSLPISAGATVSPQSANDIQLYLSHGLSKIARRFELADDWPGTNAITKLTTDAAGIFIWATTVLKYLKVNPEGRLTDVLSGSLPVGSLYGLYSRIMTKSFSGWTAEECAKIRTIVTAIGAMQVVLTLTDLEATLNFNRSTLRSICEGLRAVLQDGDYLRFAHQSFVDFLSDKSCPEQLRINPDELKYLAEIFERYFQQRFEALGALSAFNNVIEARQQIVDLAPVNQCDKKVLDNLGGSLLWRYQRFGDVEDIQRAVKVYQQALDGSTADQLSDDGGSLLPVRLGHVGGALWTRFSRLGVLQDLEDAIATQRRANELTPNDHPYKSVRLNNLGRSLHSRFKCFGKSQDVEDAVAVDRQANELTPEGHPDKPIWLSSLGDSLHSRYMHLGNIQDLEDAIAVQHRANYLTPDNHIDKRIRLNNLANSLLSRFNYLGDLQDLERSIVATRRAIELTPSDHTDKPSQLHNLGSSLHYRFERLRNRQDLEDAIAVQREANDLTPDDHPLKPIRLNNLGDSLLSRFELLGNFEDLENSIAAARRASELTPDSHTEKPIWLSNLGSSLHFRFNRLGNLQDLEDAIAASRRANELTPNDHMNKPVQLSNLGNVLHSRFKRLGNLQDLDNAIAAQRKANELTPENHVNKPVLQNLLGSFLRTRRQRLDDLKNTLELFRRAVYLPRKGHTSKFEYVEALRVASRIYFKYCGEDENV